MLDDNFGQRLRSGAMVSQCASTQAAIICNVLHRELIELVLTDETTTMDVRESFVGVAKWNIATGVAAGWFIDGEFAECALSETLRAEKIHAAPRGSYLNLVFEFIVQICEKWGVSVTIETDNPDIRAVPDHPKIVIKW